MIRFIREIHQPYNKQEEGEAKNSKILLYSLKPYIKLKQNKSINNVLIYAIISKT